MALAALAAVQIATSPAPKQLAELDFLIGKWTQTVDGSSVRLFVERGPARRSLRFELVVSSRAARSFIDEGYLWWDKESSAYRSFAMSSISNDPRKEIGRLVDRALVMVSEPFEVDGRSERTRRTVSPTKGGISFRLDLREGDAWKPRITMTLKPEKAH